MQSHAHLPMLCDDGPRPRNEAFRGPTLDSGEAAWREMCFCCKSLSRGCDVVPTVLEAGYHAHLMLSTPPSLHLHPSIRGCIGNPTGIPGPCPLFCSVGRVYLQPSLVLYAARRSTWILCDQGKARQGNGLIAVPRPRRPPRFGYGKLYSYSVLSMHPSYTASCLQSLETNESVASPSQLGALSRTPCPADYSGLLDSSFAGVLTVCDAQGKGR